MSSGLRKRAEKTPIRERFWFLPSVYNFVALLAIASAVLLDAWFNRAAFGVAPALMPVKLGIEVLGKLAVALLTMTTITFSTTMVVLSTYSAQFSPRVLQDFIADRATQRVLAIFTSGFTFSLGGLFFMNKNFMSQVLATPAVGAVWGLISIGAFIFFVHHATSWMRGNGLIDALGRETERTVERVTGNQLQKRRAQLNDTGRNALDRGTLHDVASDAAGYVLFIDLDRLFRMARRDGTVIRMRVPIGQYVLAGIPVMSVGVYDDKPINGERYRKCNRARRRAAHVPRHRLCHAQNRRDRAARRFAEP